MRTPRGWAALLLLAAALGACDGETPVRGAEAPTGAVETERRGLTVGVGYPIHLTTHCGIDRWTRFDGSYWDALGYNNSSGSAPRGLGDPVDTGVMTLISENRALYESDTGTTIELVRAGSKRPPDVVCV